MTSLNNEGRFVLAIRSLSQNIYQRILPLSQKFCDTAQEIRLRVNRPVAVVCPETTYFLTEKGGLTNTILDGSMLTVSRGDLTDTFHNICNYSVYSKHAVSINNNFPSSESRISLRPTNNKAACRINQVFCIFINKLGR